MPWLTPQPDTERTTYANFRSFLGDDYSYRRRSLRGQKVRERNSSPEVYLGKSPRMRQSNVIFGTLLLAFIVYITMRGQLPGYLDLFTKKNAPKSSSSTSSSSSSGTGGILGKLAGSLLGGGSDNSFIQGLQSFSSGGDGGTPDSGTGSVFGDTGSAGLDMSSISI